MTPESIIAALSNQFDGLHVKSSWGETSLFYNPELKLPNGVYFLTIKEQDGDNDKASDLNRADVFRVSIGVGPELYEDHFGPRPSRPSKGGIIDTGHDFGALDVVTPHPIYGWMGWVQVLNPSEVTFDEIAPLIETAYLRAREKFQKKVG